MGIKVFVTGGTGYVGNEVIRTLLREGHSVRVLVRERPRNKHTELASRDSIEFAEGDILQAETLSNTLSGCDAVIHLVGIISECGETTFEKVHVLGTENVLAAIKGAGIKRLIHMSALGTRLSAISRYHKTKWQAEEAVRNSGLEFTIFRPSLIFGPHDRFVNLFAKIIKRSPIVPIIGRSDALFQPVAVELVAQAFARSLNIRSSVNRTYDLAGPERFTLAVIIQQITAALHKKRVLIHVPRPLAHLQAAALSFIYATLLRKPPPLNRDQLLMLEEDNIGEPSAAVHDLQLNQIRLSEGIRKYLQ